MKIKLQNIYYLFRYNLSSFIRNIWFFRKALFEYRNWDHSHTLFMLKTCLIDIKDAVNNSHEIEKSKIKKLNKIDRAIYLLDRFIKDDFIELAEKELGEIKIGNINFIECKDNKDLLEMKFDDLSDEDLKHQSLVFERSIELESQMWSELFTILKGKNAEDYIKHPEDMNDYDKIQEFYDNQYDGSGLRGWWV